MQDFFFLLIVSWIYMFGNPIFKGNVLFFTSHRLSSMEDCQAWVYLVITYKYRVGFLLLTSCEGMETRCWWMKTEYWKQKKNLCKGFERLGNYVPCSSGDEANLSHGQIDSWDFSYSFFAPLVYWYQQIGFILPQAVLIPSNMSTISTEGHMN